MELFSHPFLKVNQVEDKFNSLMIALEIMLDFKTRSDNASKLFHAMQETLITRLPELWCKR